MHRTEFSAGCANTRASLWETFAVLERDGRLPRKLRSEATEPTSSPLLASPGLDVE